ncbi:MAG: S1 RNA-binding domain-containing protein, partial [Elusimicrobia bacterium]|nr:S1 RNA-binding domain-containing protein [Elusimicrobiota bacterium]
TGFLPTSLSDLRPVREPKRMLRTGVRCYIIEVNEAKKQLVLSRKAVLAEEAGKRRDELLAKLRVGEVRVGRVVNVLPAGAVVDIGGAEGLVRSADMAWNPAKAPKLRRGDKLRVKVLSKPAARPEGQAAQPQAEPIALGIKQLSPNPADALKRKYAPKATVRGKVLEAGAAGVRLELADKAVAFAGAAEIDAQAAYKPGQELSAIVLGVNAQTCEVMVSINKYDEIKERKRLAQYLKAPPPLTLGQLLAPEEREGE